MTRSHYRPYALLAILFGTSVDGFVVTQPSSSSLLSPQQHPARYRCAALAVPRRPLARYHRPLSQSNSDNDDNIDNPIDNNNDDEQDSVPNNNEAPSEFSRRQRIRQRVADMASKMVPKSISKYAMPEAIASVLKEATLGAVEEVMSRGEDDNGKARSSLAANAPEGDPTKHLLRMIDEAFRPVEESLDEVQENLVDTRSALAAAKLQAKDAIRVVQAAAAAQVQGAATAVRAAGVVAGRTAVAEIYATNNNVDISDLAYDDIDFATSEMAPPFLGEDQCLVPGEAVVRVEKAPENSRRIFAGIDIGASVDTVWDVLTDYANLQQVVPNLAVNLVQQVFPGKAAEDICIDETQSDLEQCKEMASQLKGSVLAQVGGVSSLAPLACALLLDCPRLDSWSPPPYHVSVVPTRMPCLLHFLTCCCDLTTGQGGGHQVLGPYDARSPRMATGPPRLCALL
jgi:hypothetical protein